MYEKVKIPDTRTFDLDRLNSMTKYPSILTYHELGDRGVLNDVVLTPFPVDLLLELTEKVDGTNARMVFCPDGTVIIGSREDFLWATYDLIGNPAMGIVSYLKPIVCRLANDRASWPITGKIRERWMPPSDEYKQTPIFVLYGEVYGKSIGSAAKQYTSTGKVGFRLFDVAVIDNFDEILGWERERISSWRDNGGQTFLSTEKIRLIAHNCTLDSVPLLGTMKGDQMPTTLADTQAFLQQYSQSQANLDCEAGGRSEGVVIRTTDRKTIAKLRFEDYARKRK